MHVDLDRIGADFVAPFAQVLHQLLFAHYTAGALQQYLEQAGLTRRQINLPVVDAGNAPGEVVAEIAVLDQRWRPAQAAPHQGAHAGFEFRQIKRLGHVVVGPEVEALDTFIDAIARGENQHRHALVGAAGFRAQAAQHLQARHLGQPQIENQEIVGFGAGRRIGLGAGACMIYRITGTAQAAAQAVGQHGVIFSEQNAHGFALLF